MATEERDTEQALREVAIKRLKKKQDLRAHLLIYTLVNAFLVAIWAFTGRHFFWPLFPIVGWGIGVVMNVWDVYRNEQPTPAQIEREMQRLQHRP